LHAEIETSPSNSEASVLNNEVRQLTSTDFKITSAMLGFESHVNYAAAAEGQGVERTTLAKLLFSRDSRVSSINLLP
jgi:hypothetical protein